MQHATREATQIVLGVPMHAGASWGSDLWNGPESATNAVLEKGGKGGAGSPLDARLPTPAFRPLIIRGTLEPAVFSDPAGSAPTEERGLRSGLRRGRAGLCRAPRGAGWVCGGGGGSCGGSQERVEEQGREHRPCACRSEFGDSDLFTTRRLSTRVVNRDPVLTTPLLKVVVTTPPSTDDPNSDQI